MAELNGLVVSWSSELDSVVDRARMLLGGKHWLTVGTYKEEILKNWLLRFMPASVRLGTGFICPRVAGSLPSRQLDILIASSERHPFWLEEGDLYFVPEESYIAHVEVKSTLTKDSQEKALVNAASAFLAIRKAGIPRSLWAGIYSFAAASGAQLTSSQVERLLECLCHLAEKSIKGISDWTMTLAIHNQLIIRLEQRQKTLLARGYFSREFTSALFLSDVLENLCGEVGDLSSLTSFLSSLRTESVEFRLNLP